MTCIIVQSRLDSTRLPRKALLDLAGKSVLVRVMENLRRIPADFYVLACDADSESVFSPLAASCGFMCIGGPKEDVLERFCIVIRHTGASIVLRATGDNPFLFADAAEASLRRFKELQTSVKPADYFTFSGLPHGSGIEVFSARRLIEAAALTDAAYDREHVGPALYNHGDRFTCVREIPPVEWYHPEVRTTIDTPEDYERSCLMVDYFTEKGLFLPVSSRLILDAYSYVSNTLVFIPSVKNAQGTGHLRRIVNLIEKMRSHWRCLLYIPHGSDFASLVPESLHCLLIEELPSSAYKVIIDHFRSTEEEIKAFRKIGPVIAIDEGGSGRPYVEYLLDILPALTDSFCPANFESFLYLPLPIQRKNEPVSLIRSVLVLAGGENAAGLAIPIGTILAGLGFDVTVIDPSFYGIKKEHHGLTVISPIPNLKESLHTYDLVVTHYGFTAFEALAAGCKVILFSPTLYHFRLGISQGFSVILPGKPSASSFQRILSREISVPEVITVETVQQDLSEKIEQIVAGTKRNCPLCGNGSHPKIIARFPDRTIAECSECGMHYLSFLISEEQTYSKSYFFDEYRSQYGKTYLEDFESIREMGKKRLAVLDAIVRKTFHYLEPDEKKLLDIGCAYGPFLSAAQEALWNVTGTDISEDAIEYVRNSLHINAVVSAFPAPDRENSLKETSFAAVTLWYVIEHFEDLEAVLQRIRSLLIPGGILAFSTPSRSGVSGFFNPLSFYQNSPKDHFTLWKPRDVKKQLARYGFTVQRIVSTGHHPERFPCMRGCRPDSLKGKLCSLISHVCSLGDTFEVYAVKNGTIEDIQ